MASAQASSQSDRSDQAVLSHFAKRLLQTHGGNLSVVQFTERADNEFDLSTDISSLLELGENNGTYHFSNGETKEITAVNPVGTEPRSVSLRFGNTTSIESLVTDQRDRSALKKAGYLTCKDIATADAEDLKEDINNSFESMGGWGTLSDTIPDSLATEAILDALRDCGFDTPIAIARAPESALESAAPTITPTKAAEIKNHAEQSVGLWNTNDAETLISEAEEALPNLNRLFSDSMERYLSKMDDSGGSANVHEIETEDTTVGDPLAVTRYDLSLEALRDHRKEVPADVQYVSDVGPNEDSPVKTGLAILEDTGYQKIPRPDTHPDAGDDALPTDEDGDVIPPAIPMEPRRQLPLDELVAKKLRRGPLPVCLVGPPGCGKNYLFKYLAWATNRGYRSIDASSSTMAEDLFGPLTPDEDGAIVSRNGPVKQGLLNGDITVINEFPVMQAGAATALHRLLNEGKLLIKSHGQLIEPHPAARLVITQNPPTSENRATEPMSRPTRGRFRRFKMSYPGVEEEVRALDQQVNTTQEVVAETTLRKIVEFAHTTREPEKDHWPTLSTRNLTILCEDIEDGVEPKAAVKGALWAVAEPYQQPGDANEVLNERF